jgi:O-antigen/teichoic acid export membrane protein
MSDFRLPHQEPSRKRFELSAIAARLTSLAEFRKSREAQGGVANLFAIISQIVIQLISVPIMIHAIGLNEYGIWLMLSTIPTYLVLSDLGLVTAATNEMTIRYASKDSQGVLTTFHSISFVIMLVFGVLSFLSIIFVGTISLIGDYWAGDFQLYAWSAVFLTIYASLCIISMLPVAVLRATGHYARGTLMYDVCTFVEAMLILVVATISKNLALAAAAPMIFRALALAVIYRQMRRFQPEIGFGRTSVQMNKVRQLLPAAVSVMAIPAGLAISLQGTSLVIGALIGSVAVATFSAVRTASRMAILLAGVVSRALIPELAAARGRNDTDAEDRYWRINGWSKWLMLVPASVLFGLLGARIVELWTNGAVSPPQSLIWLMSLTIAAHGSWYLNVTLLTASHDHIAVAPFVPITCLFGLAVATLLISPFGLLGAAASLFIVDATLALFVGSRVQLLKRRRKNDPRTTTVADL